MRRQPHVRDFEILHGDYELVVLIMADVDEEVYTAIARRVRFCVPAATVHEVILTADPAQCESVFRLGGLAAIRQLVEERDDHRAGEA